MGITRGQPRARPGHADAEPDAAARLSEGRRRGRRDQDDDPVHGRPFLDTFSTVADAGITDVALGRAGPRGRA